ncbi:hypothetical protein PR048_006571 [Dryococelus australis]|uniref:Uncharacterized protein n=1 Tax=Dryococelus australis TaxID=614101 RepID=A0ABQ9IBC0_9NEOP|nr:hypothetical protein PR048_006571 [Dryococelus australis]
MTARDALILKANKLVGNGTMNQSERYMSYDLNTEAVRYGRVNESKAIYIFQEKFNEQVMLFELFIRQSINFWS